MLSVVKYGRDQSDNVDNYSIMVKNRIQEDNAHCLEANDGSKEGKKFKQFLSHTRG